MTENNTNTDQETDDTKGGNKFTSIVMRKELDRIIGERIVRKRNKYAGLDDIRAKAEQYDAMGVGSRSLQRKWLGRRYNGIIGRSVKDGYRKMVAYNSKRYACVPTGTYTCLWCVMLAREKFRGIVNDIANNADEVVYSEFKGQPAGVKFHIKGYDVVITTHSNEYISTLKGGSSNARVKKARKQEI
ncbi:hypothetical protein LQZ18_09360 [Lachnospiraceae bacterium ZAX-1]